MLYQQQLPLNQYEIELISAVIQGYNALFNIFKDGDNLFIHDNGQLKTLTKTKFTLLVRDMLSGIIKNKQLSYNEKSYILKKIKSNLLQHPENQKNKDLRGKTVEIIDKQLKKLNQTRPLPEKNPYYLTVNNDINNDSDSNHHETKYEFRQDINKDEPMQFSFDNHSRWNTNRPPSKDISNNNKYKDNGDGPYRYNIHSFLGGLIKLIEQYLIDNRRNIDSEQYFDFQLLLKHLKLCEPSLSKQYNNHYNMNQLPAPLLVVIKKLNKYSWWRPGTKLLKKMIKVYKKLSCDTQPQYEEIDMSYSYQPKNISNEIQPVKVYNDAYGAIITNENNIKYQEINDNHSSYDTDDSLDANETPSDLIIANNPYQTLQPSAPTGDDNQNLNNSSNHSKNNLLSLDDNSKYDTDDEIKDVINNLNNNNTDYYHNNNHFLSFKHDKPKNNKADQNTLIEQAIEEIINKFSNELEIYKTGKLISLESEPGSNTKLLQQNLSNCLIALKTIRLLKKSIAEESNYDIGQLNANNDIQSLMQTFGKIFGISQANYLFARIVDPLFIQNMDNNQLGFKSDF